MNISQGIYRGCKIDIGIIPGTSGQMTVNLDFGAEELKKFTDTITEEEIRKLFNFPERNGTNFTLTVFKEEHAISWQFFYETIGRCTQYEYLNSIFRSIDNLIAHMNATASETPKE